MKKFLVWMHIVFTGATAQAFSSPALTDLVTIGEQLSVANTLTIETEDGLVFGPLIDSTPSIYKSPFDPEQKHNFLRRFRSNLQTESRERSTMKKIKAALTRSNELNCEIALQRLESLREIRLLCRGAMTIDDTPTPLRVVAQFQEFQESRWIFRSTSKPYQLFAVDIGPSIALPSHAPEDPLLHAKAAVR